jgi:hypothetical protein
MSTTTQVQPLIDPTELESFEEAQEKIKRARGLIDRIPAELDDDSASTAADALKEARFAVQDLEVSRKAEKEPYAVTGRRIDADFNELKSSLEAAMDSLKARVIAYNARVQKAAEEERKRIERNAEARQKREDEKAAKENRASHDKRGAPAPPPPPPSARGMNAKTTIKKVKKYRIEDESLLPDHLVKRVPDKLKIKAAVNAGEAIPGVRMWEEDEVATR